MIGTTVTCCPAPGIFYNVPWSEYADWDALNGDPYAYRSSPKHMHAYVTGQMPRGDSADKRFGRGMHCYVLEREAFDARFPIAQTCCATTNQGKKNQGKCKSAGRYVLAWDPERGGGVDWYCGTHAPEAADEPVDFCTTYERERFESIRQSLLKSSLAGQFARPGNSEVSIVLELHGFKIKCRLDRYCPPVAGAKGNSLFARPLIKDLKKVQVGGHDADSFAKSVVNYGYHRKAALYVKAMEILTGERPEFAWVVIEDDAPFDCNVIFASEDDIRIGWEEVNQALQAYRYALDKGNLFGVLGPEGKNRTIGALPQWYVRRALEV